MKWLKPLILWVPLHLPLSWIQPLHYSAWDEQKKNNNPGSFDAQYLWAYKVTRHSVAWYRPETKAWTKPELASLLSVAMTTAAVLRLKKRKKSPQRTCGEGLHPLGEFTDLTWQPKFNIIILFTWKHETRRLQMDTFPKSSSLSLELQFTSIAVLCGLFTVCNWMRLRVCCYCWQVQKQVEQVVPWMPLCWALLPHSMLLSPGPLLIRSHTLAAHWRDFVACAPVRIWYSLGIR